MKIETKNNLWRCHITSGCYSDRSESFLVVSGNSFEEAVNALKIFYQTMAEEEFKNRGYNSNKGLVIVGDGLNIKEEKWQYGRAIGFDDSIDWDTRNSSNTEKVKISPLEVVYTYDEIAKPSL